ncbi:MAG: CBS domain-containing protein, partial [Polyangia bacterium]
MPPDEPAIPARFQPGDMEPDLLMLWPVSTHIVGLHRPAHLRLNQVVTFHGVRERKASMPLAMLGEERVEAARICCQRGALLKSSAECAACPRFLGWRDGADGLHVRCAWIDRDSVRDCMTVAGALIVTPPHATCDDATRLARRHGLRRLLVVDAMRLVGVVSLGDLGGSARLVGECMSREIFAVFSGATLGEAAAAMVALGVGMLPVIGQHFVVGVISRG